MTSVTPEIETERLLLRGFAQADLTQIFAIWSDPVVMKHLGGKPLSREDTWRRVLAAHGPWTILGYGYWVVERKSDRRLIAQIGFADFKRDMDPSIEGEPEVGWVLASEAHGQGYAGEACRAALDWADRNLDASSYPAIIAPANAPSIKLAERLGFEREPDAQYKGEAVALFRRAARRNPA